jgi:hypothetical protein
MKDSLVLGAYEWGQWTEAVQAMLPSMARQNNRRSAKSFLAGVVSDN